MNGGTIYTSQKYKSHINYIDFIQGKEFEKNISYAMKDQTKDIIANNEQLARENYKVMEQINDGISSGFTSLKSDIESLHNSVDSGFQRISTIIEWGFSEILVSLGRVNDSLDDLIKIAKTPAQTWAFEQFEIARDEFRRGLYSESLESILRAINGYGSNTGYKTEYRFHFLQGTIRLGSYKNSDRKVVDLSDSEAAFLKAARYSSNDFPAEAARSLLCAGRAAFNQGKIDVALKHSTDAIALDGSLAEAYFQSAQACCSLDLPKDASVHLLKAIIFDHNYSVKAASDGDIFQYPEMLSETLLNAKDKLKRTFDQEKNIFSKSLKKISSIEIDGYAVNKLCSAQIEDAYHHEKNIVDEAANDNIFGYVYAARLARDGKKIIQSVIISFQRLASQHLEEEKIILKNAIDSSSYKLRSEKPMLSNFLGDMIDGMPFFIVIILSPILLVMKFFRESSWEKELSKAKSDIHNNQNKLSVLQATSERIASFNIQD